MCCYSKYHVANGEQLAKAFFVSNTVSKLLDTVCIIFVSSLHMLPDFLLWHRIIINIKLASNAIA